MSPPIPVLLVAHQVPPVLGPGSRRPASWIREWPRRGVEPVVLAGLADDARRFHGYPIGDVGDAPEPPGVHRVAVPPPRGLAEVLRRTGVPPRVRRLLAYVALREPESPWEEVAVAAGLALARRAAVRAIVSTSQPYVAHRVGRRIARALSLPWVADFRDPMTEAEGRSWPTRLHWLRERAEERRLLADADLVWVTSEALAERWRSRHPRVAGRIRLRRNGVGPVALAALATPPPPPPLVIGHVGRFTDSPRRSRLRALECRPNDDGHGDAGGGSSPTPLLRALARFLARRPEARGRVVWRTVGSDASEPAPDGVVRDARPAVPNAEALRLAATCHALYLPLTRPGRFGTQFVQQKVYEYAALGRPVLVTGTPREATDLLGPAALVAAEDDVETLARHVEALWDGRSAGSDGCGRAGVAPTPPSEADVAAACADDLLALVSGRARARTRRGDAARARRA